MDKRIVVVFGNRLVEKRSASSNDVSGLSLQRF